MLTRLTKYKKTILTVCFLIVVIVLSYIEICIYHQTFISSIKSITSLTLIISALIALNVYITTVDRHTKEDGRHESKKFLKESIGLLKRIYKTFIDSKEPTLPENDRYLWLTIARMILTYYETKNKITEQIDKEIIEAYEDYSRFQLYKVFNSAGVIPKDYFQKENGAENLEPRSVLTVFDFMTWPAHLKDPLDEVILNEIFNNVRGALLSQPNAEDYVEGLIRKTQNY